MNHLFQKWDELVPRFQNSHLLLFLDYDGTLTPITEHPESAKLSDSMRIILNDLKLIDDLCITIISGRSLVQLKTFVGVPGLTYVGNHGFEIEGPGFQHIHPGALEARVVINEVREVLEGVFRTMHGVILENKIFTLSVHYRQIPEDEIDRVRMMFLKAIHPFLEQGKIIFTEGKMVLEVRPALSWNKGTAVTWLYGRELASNPSRKTLPIYIGDDRTDEAALKAIKDCGIGVKVAEDTAESNAGYYLRNPDEIYDFLKRVQKLKSGMK